MIYIRVDMNNIIGTGHVMRCLSIADAANKLGNDVTFILADENAVKMISQKGYRYIVLQSKWNDIEAELPKLLWIIQNERITSLLIDSYCVTEKYLQVLMKRVKTIYIDDVNAFRYSVNTLICYANYYKKFRYGERYHDTKLLLGTKYVPLREEFAECPPKVIKTFVKNILIMSGGTDSYYIVPKLIEKSLELPINNVFVICGMYNQNYDQLFKKYQDRNSIKIIYASSDLKHYMDLSDIAITAAGTTLYELCATGTPAVSYILADNQEYNAIQFDADGIIPCAGDVRKEDISDKIIMLTKGLFSKDRRQSISLKMQGLVDGKGAERVARFIDSL